VFCSAKNKHHILGPLDAPRNAGFAGLVITPVCLAES